MPTKTGIRKKLNDVTLSDVVQTYSEERYQDRIVVDKHFCMVMSGDALSDIMDDEIVYLRQQASVVFVTSGSIETAIDMEDFTWRAGDIILIKPNTIQEKKSTSEDFNMIALDFEDSNQVKENIILHVKQTEQHEFLQMAHTLWDIARHKPFRRNTVMAMVTAIVSNIYEIALEQRQQQPNKNISNEEQILRKFRELVNENADNERNVLFYAAKMCLTSDYLSKVVKQASGLTVMQWINRAVSLHAKVLLTTTELTTYEIAEQLHFPDYSSFSRFFKRETGITPREFRKGK
jgi:AraC-like DNA-binding protein